MLQPGRAAGVVTNCTEAALRAAVSGGGEVTFACDGTITLAETLVIAVDTTLDGSGHAVTISGGGAVRVLEVNPGVKFSLVKLGVANGKSTNGAGLYNRGGTVTLTQASFFSNQAIGSPGSAESSGGAGCGGAVFNDRAGTVHVILSQFSGNGATGGPGGNGLFGGAGGSGQGGGVYNLGAAWLGSSVFSTNLVSGGPGGLSDIMDEFGNGAPGSSGGGASGGATYNLGSLTINGSAFVANSAQGGPGGSGGAGVYAGAGGNGGAGVGGGVNNAGGAVTMTNCTFFTNSARGGNGGDGGEATPAEGFGGDGGNGRAGLGGGLYSSGGTAKVSNCTYSHNRAMAGAGGLGQPGLPGPDGSHNGRAGLAGVGLGGCVAKGAGTLVVEESILAFSLPEGTASGAITDGGYNLSTDSSLNFTAPGSQVVPDPRLGPPADNGGPTPTMALLPGSPAIDAVTDVACAATDQRGLPRPQGAACDIGAFEGTLQYLEVDQRFEPAQIEPEGISLLHVTLSNPNSITVSGISFTDLLPAGLMVAMTADPSGACGGSLSAMRGGYVIALTNATLGPTQTCAFSIPVTAQLPGLYTNSFSVGAPSQMGDNRVASQAFLQVLGRPEVSTWSATDAGLQSVVFRAEVNPHGSPTSCYFEYGVTADYGQRTATIEVGIGTGVVTVTNAVSGLLPGTTYHYRAVASNALGTARGGDQTTATLTSALYAAHLDGASGFLASPNLTRFFTNETMTIELWFRAEAAGVLIDERGSTPPAGGWQASLLEVLNTGEVRARVYNLAPFSLGVVGFGEWHHAALRYNKATLTADGMLDGVISTSVSGDRSAPHEQGHQFFLAFGLQDLVTFGSGAYFQGDLDEIRIWSVARTDAQIRAFQEASLLGTEPGLVANWRLDEWSGITAPDSSPNGNAAALSGSVSRARSGAVQHSTRPPIGSEFPLGELTATSVAILGKIMPHGHATTAWFEYGRWMDYGNTTASEVIAADIPEGIISATLTNLLPGAQYHYRIVATNSVGVWQSDDLSFYMPSGAAALKAISLDGVDDFLTTPDLTSLLPSDTMTIELWFKAESAGVVIDEGGHKSGLSPWQATVLEILSTGELKARLWNLPALSLGVVRFGEWHHVALRYGQDPRVLQGFLDGAKTSPLSVGDRSAPVESGYTAVYHFGLTDKNNIGSGTYFKGQLDEIRIWNVARGDADIRRNVFRSILPQAGLVCYWRCNDDGSGVLLDDSGNGNAGLKHGQPVFVVSTAPVGSHGPGGTTLTPTDLGLSSATLHGTVFPSQELNTAYFEWGATTNFGSRTPPQLVPPTTSETAIAAPLADLVPGTRYYTRLVVESQYGVGYGLRRMFETVGSGSGQAVSLDGASGYMATPNLQSQFVDESMTIELWFRADGPGVLIDERGQKPPADGWRVSFVEVMNTGEVRARVHNLAPISLGTITFGQWHHVAIRYDKAELRADGCLDGLESPTLTSGDRGAPWESGYGCYYAFGLADANHLGSGAYFKGAVDEVRIWNVPRTLAQLRANMRTRLRGTEPSLIAYWRCDERSGSTVTDSASNDNTATLGGMWSWADSGVPLGLPQATTLPASNLGPDSATVAGFITDCGWPTTLYFHWGVTTNYGNRAAAEMIQTNPTYAAVSATITGLLPKTTYHFRLVAQAGDATIEGSDRSFTTPPVGGGMAITLDGTGAYLSTRDLQAHFVDKSMTIELWFRAEAAGVLIDERGSTRQASLLEVLNTGEVKARVWNLTPVSLGVVSFGEWHHAAVRYDMTTRRLDGFLDGASPGVAAPGDRWAPWEFAGGCFYAFGRADTTHMGSGAHFNGALDEIRIWNLPRTDAELLVGKSTRLSGREPGLVAYWRCDDGAGTMARDATANSNTLLLNSRAAWIPSGVELSTISSQCLPADRLTGGSARLNGVLLPNGSECRAYFQWGQTSSFGNASPSQAIAGNQFYVPISAELAGLDPATHYYYRLALQTSEGTSFSSTRGFDTTGTAAGLAVSLDGVDDYLFTRDLRTFFTNEAITIELWFNATTPGVLIDERGLPPASESTHMSLMEVLQSGELVARVNGLATISLGSVALEEWHHVALRYDKSLLRLDAFLDGVASTPYASGDRVAPWETGGRVYYGFGLADGSHMGNGAYFKGALDEIRIWGRARTAAEIIESAADPLAGTEVGLVSYWRLDEGVGVTAGDASGHGNTGTLVTGPTWCDSTAPLVRLPSVYPTINGRARVFFFGLPGQTYRLEASTDLLLWNVILTNSAGTRGVLQFEDPAMAHLPLRFYRTARP